MTDINMMIANNILEILRKQGKKQMDLAEGIGVSKQTMSKMLNGGRMINAIELKKISDYLKVPMERIMKTPDTDITTDVIHTFMGRVETEEAKEAIRVADEVSNLIIFHNRVRENGLAMMKSGEA